MTPLERIRQLYGAYLQGRLEEGEAEELCRLVQADPRARQEILDDREMHGLLGQLRAGDEAEMFRRSLLERVAAEKDGSRFLRKVESNLSKPRPAAWRLSPAVVLLIAGVILVALWLGLRDRSEPRESSPAEGPSRAARVVPKAPPPPEPSVPEKIVVPGPRPDKEPRLPERPELKPPVETPAPESKPPAPPVPPAPAPKEDPPPAPKPTETVVATIEKAEGEAVVLSPTGQRPAVAGQSLLAGEGAQTGARGALTLAYPDKTRLEMGPETVLQNVRLEDGKRLSLSKGRVLAQVTPQPKGRPMVIASPSGEARVVGTTFRLAVDPDPKKGTRLEVEEGKVELKNAAGKIVLVESGNCATAGTGIELVSRPSLPAPKPRLTAQSLPIYKMAPNSWYAVPQTRMRKVVPDPGRFPKLQGEGGGPETIVSGWSGGAFDARRNQLLVWGGGSGSYYGNELYAFRVDSLTWERLTEPTPDPEKGPGVEVNRDGTPVSRSTYNGLAVIAHADRLFAAGGVFHRSGSCADLTWTFALDSRKWKNMSPAGSLPQTQVAIAAAYDPMTRKVWWLNGDSNRSNGLYSYDYDANRWTRHTSDQVAGRTCAVDTRRGLLVAAGGGEVIVYDLRLEAPTQEKWKTDGGDPIVSSASPGFDYDPVADRFVGWVGGAVYVLDPTSRTWTTIDAPNAPKPGQNGIFGRWRYVPGVDAFIAVTGIDVDVSFFKLTPTERRK